MVSVDQFMSGLSGCLPKTAGKEQKTKQYTGGTLFVDHMTAMIYISHQIFLQTGETLKGKHQFERFAKEQGVQVKAYHADNHPFGSAKAVLR
jgi:hypothetical protein